MKKLMAFLKDEDGLETVEYAVMLGLIVVALVTAISALSGWVSDKFGEVSTTVDTPI
jgi:Flp pilus assembly pilin Flp